MIKKTKLKDKIHKGKSVFVQKRLFLLELVTFGLWFLSCEFFIFSFQIAIFKFNDYVLNAFSYQKHSLK